MVLYLGRIHKVKGIDLLLQAFSTIFEELPSAKLVVVGPDEDGSLSVLKKQIEHTPMNDCVMFTGPLYGKTKLEAYTDADVYVLPSRYETFPLTVLEATACGTPVILTDRCGIAHIFERYGLVVEYDVGQLRDVLYKLLTDDAKRRQLGQDMHDLVVSKFTWDKIITEVEATYRDVLREN
jgi:glycosyltransferase involved in cell wall biosynthesis